MDSNEHNEIDRAIDAALEQYAAVEPLDGLERRVLNRVSEAIVSRRMGTWFGFALAVAAASLLVMIGVLRHPVPSPKKVAHVTAATAPAAEVREAPVPVVRRHPHFPRRLPIARQFPVPTPLSSEERALLAFVEHHPAEAEKVLAEPRRPVSEPLNIDPIEIKPLPSDGE